MSFYLETGQNRWKTSVEKSDLKRLLVISDTMTASPAGDDADVPAAAAPASATGPSAAAAAAAATAPGAGTGSATTASRQRIAQYKEERRKQLAAQFAERRLPSSTEVNQLCYQSVSLVPVIHGSRS